MGVLTTREVASAIWSVILIGGLMVLASKSQRASIGKSLMGVIKAVASPYLLIPAILMLVYAALVVWLLYYVGLWRVSILKETLFWLVPTLWIVPSLATDKRDSNIWTTYVADSIKLLVIIQFVVEEYTFAFWEEMLIVPFIGSLILLDTAATMKPEHVYMSRLFKSLQALAGGVIVVLAISSAIADYRNLGSVDTLRSLLIAPVLSLAFVPVIYALRLYVNYELLFNNLKIDRNKSPEVMRYARRRFVQYFGLRNRRVLGFIRSPKRKELYQAQSKEDIDKLLEDERP